MKKADTYSKLATWQVLARWRDTGAVAYDKILCDRTEAQQFADSFPSSTYTVSIYAANTFAHAIVSAEQIKRADMTDDELLAELGL